MFIMALHSESEQILLLLIMSVLKNQHFFVAVITLQTGEQMYVFGTQKK